MTKKGDTFTIMKSSQNTQCIIYFTNYSESSSFLSTFLCIIILLYNQHIQLIFNCQLLKKWKLWSDPMSMPAVE